MSDPNAKNEPVERPVSQTTEELIEVLRKRIDYLERENNLLRFEVRQQEYRIYGSNH